MVLISYYIYELRNFFFEFITLSECIEIRFQFKKNKSFYLCSLNTILFEFSTLFLFFRVATSITSKKI